MEQYRRTADRRCQAEETARAERRDRAWAAARQAAALLRDHYGVWRVVAFGSLTHPSRFTQWSDIDLAAWGLVPSNWLRAMAAVRSQSDEFEINLVDMASCPPELAASIERDGTPL